MLVLLTQTAHVLTRARDPCTCALGVGQELALDPRDATSAVAGGEREEVAATMEEMGLSLDDLRHALHGVPR